MDKNLIWKKVLALIAVPVLGFFLLNLTFMFDFLIQSLVNLIFPAGYDMTVKWFPVSKHILFIVIIALISWFVFKSKLKDFPKAIYSMIPTAVVLVTVGVFLYQWPMLTYVAGVLIYGAIIFYLYKTKKSWLFYYSVTLVALALLVMGFLGMDI